MSRVLHGILIFGHDHRLECGHCLSCNYLEYMSFTRGFCPVSGFSPAGLSLAVLSSWLVLNDSSVRQYYEQPGRVFVAIVSAMTISCSR